MITPEPPAEKFNSLSELINQKIYQGEDFITYSDWMAEFNSTLMRSIPSGLECLGLAIFSKDK
jgi:hypothetical protein